MFNKVYELSYKIVEDNEDIKCCRCGFKLEAGEEYMYVFYKGNEERKHICEYQCEDLKNPERLTSVYNVELNQVFHGKVKDIPWRKESGRE